ncbi:hypothetical protein [Porphyromonas pogonae]|uniref:hypothetical protein n=1 Tax=Porphyromonas pogonae TaxID=867595 RepID=UPI002E7892E7|nr:hypothetical protein [Porphyromonas pogonae]
MIDQSALYMKQPTYYHRLEQVAHEFEVWRKRVEGGFERKCNSKHKLRISDLGRAGVC